jgi:uncharacterized protein
MSELIHPRPNKIAGAPDRPRTGDAPSGADPGAGSALVPPYVPSRRWSGGHVMTIYAWARRRAFPDLPVPEARRFSVAADACVLAHCYWQPSPAGRPALLALHGLEGSSSAHYMRGLAAKAFRRGWNAILLNQRNCGGTESLSAGLYHSGLCADPAAVIRELIDRDGLSRIAVVGYSLGGNLALRLAGEYADAAPAEVRAVCAVSPTMDLRLCVDALERGPNVAYQWNFVRNLKARMRRKARHFPDRFDLDRLSRVWTVRGFDEAYTAPHHGFRDAADYYYRASSLRVVDRIRVPALIISAADDPFVPSDQFMRPEVRGNPHLQVIVTPQGGHCAFVSEGAADHDGYWAEHAAITFAARHMEQ